MLILRNIIRRNFSSIKDPLILGIETTCDDTGIAILRGNKVLGESIASQMRSHLKFGGIIPPVAQEFHRQNIERVANECFERAQIDPNELDAIAFANRPGLALSLMVGTRFARFLSRKYQKPLIPVHHMHAHALTVRMENKIEFPFLCLLISGGHSLLTYVRDVNDFLLLGESTDDAPGEALDKIARRLKLRNIRQFDNKNGGQSIEEAASMCENVTDKYYFPLMMKFYRDCQFSFSGLKNVAFRHIAKQERDLKLDVDEVIPDYPNFCANVLGAVARHICHRTQRAIEFCESRDWFKDVEQKTLVVSGGVASNNFIFNALDQMCEKINFKAIRPSRKLCCDNGVMIAYTGVELFKKNFDICPVEEIDKLDFIAKCSIGESYINEVKAQNISCNWIKTEILKPYARC